MRLILHLFILLIFANAIANAQDIIGRWIVEDAKIEGKKYSREQLENLRLWYLKESKGKIIEEYKSNGIFCTFSVQDSDTIQFYETKWWKSGNNFYKAGDSGDKQFTCKRNNSERYESSYYPDADYTLTTKYIFVPGHSKPQYSDNTFASYAKAGMPPLNKKWTIEEYRNAAQIVCDLEFRKITTLPHHYDSSFVILKKLTDCDSMEFLTKEKINKNTLPAITSFLMRTYNITKGYTKLKDVKGKLYYSMENVMIMKAWLKLSDRSIEILKELGLGETDGVKTNVNEVTEGCFITFIDEYESYKPEDLCSYYEVFLDFYIKNKSILDIEQRDAFDKKLNTIKKKHTVPCLRRPG